MKVNANCLVSIIYGSNSFKSTLVIKDNETDELRMIDFNEIEKIKRIYQFINIYEIIQNKSTPIESSSSSFRNLLKRLRWFDLETFLLHFFQTGTKLGFWKTNSSSPRISMSQSDEIVSELISNYLLLKIPFEINLGRPEDHLDSNKFIRHERDIPIKEAFLSRTEIVNLIQEKIAQQNSHNGRVFLDFISVTVSSNQIEGAIRLRYFIENAIGEEL